MEELKKKKGGKKGRRGERLLLAVSASPSSSLPVDLIKALLEWKVGWSTAMTGSQWDPFVGYRGLKKSPPFR